MQNIFQKEPHSHMINIHSVSSNLPFKQMIQKRMHICFSKMLHRFISKQKKLPNAHNISSNSSFRISPPTALASYGFLKSEFHNILPNQKFIYLAYNLKV